VAASVETHLIACAACRAAVASRAPTQPLHEQWEGIVDVIDRPRPSLTERLVRALGVDEGAARLVGATAPLQLRWFAAVIAVTVSMVWYARRIGSDELFLFGAPLVPLGAVAVTFFGLPDPAGEAGLVAPNSGGRLLLRRAMIVFASCFVVLGAGAAALPEIGAAEAAWVLPALALTAVSIALTTWFPVTVAIGSSATTWILLLTLASSRDWASPANLAAAGSQLAALVVLTIGALVATSRRALLPIGANR
jgi:hypothetical protein